MAEALIGGERTRSSALSPRRTRPRRASAHANEAWDVSGIRAAAERARGRGPAGRARRRAGPQNGHARPPEAAKREHPGPFLGESNLRPPSGVPATTSSWSALAAEAFAPLPALPFGGASSTTSWRSPPPLPPPSLSSFLPLFPYAIYRNARGGGWFSFLLRGCVHAVGL